MVLAKLPLSLSSGQHDPSREGQPQHPPQKIIDRTFGNEIELKSGTGSECVSAKSCKLCYWRVTRHYRRYDK